MATHDGSIDPETSRRGRGLTVEQVAALAALRAEAEGLSAASRQRLREHLEGEADRGNEQDKKGSDGDRGNAP